MSLLPLRGESKVDPGEPRVVGLDGEEADEAFEVLSATTTRRVLSFLYQQPSTPAEIRDQIGTSLQNVHYHIGKLEDAGLIEAAGSGYSEKGTEMTVYAPANEAIVLFAGRQSDQSRFKQLLSRVFGTVVALFAVAIGYAYVLRERANDAFFSGQSGDGPQLSREDAAGAGADDGGGGGADAGAEATTTKQSGVDVAENGTDGDGGVGVMSNDATTTAGDQQTVTEEAARATTEATRTVTDGGADVAIQSGQHGIDALLADPAFAFVLGGLFVLFVLGTIWAVQRRR